MTLLVKLKNVISLLIKDDKGLILYERDLAGYQSRDKVCGVWESVPTIFRSYLKAGQLTVILTTKEYNKGELSGQIIKHPAADRETITALLRSDVRHVTSAVGGLAMLTIDGAGEKLTYTVLLHRQINERIKKEDKKETITVRFMFRKEILEEKSFVMSNHDVEFTQVWIDRTSRNSRRLTRGRIRLVVMTSSGLELGGDVTVRPVCETLQAVLSGHDTDHHQETDAAGSAEFAIDDRGFVQFKIRLVGLPNKLSSLTLNYPSSGRQADSTQIIDVEKDFVPDSSGTSGWAVGLYDKPKSVEIHKLLTDQVYVNVRVQGVDIVFLSGRVTSLPYSPHIDTWAESPFMLTGIPTSGTSKPHGSSGHAWFAFSATCTLHYQIVASGLSSGDSTDAQRGLVELGEYVSGEEPQLQSINDFIGHVVIGNVDNIGEYMLEAMNVGHAFVQISTKNYKKGEIRGNITVPNMCKKNGEVGVMGDGEEKKKNNWCKDNGKEYKNYDVWSSGQCVTCTCKSGEKECQTEICPDLDCKDQEKLPDTCCPRCKPKGEKSPVQPSNGRDHNDSCYFSGDEKWHKRGTKWHPYLFPFGFMRCALCSCKENENKVDCVKITCPTLECPESVAIKPETECCRVCPDKWADNLDSGNPDEQGDLGNAKFCDVGDSRVEDGAEWNPKVVDGVMGCITCRCLGGKVNCERKKCSKVDCPNGFLILTPGSCCPTCTTSGDRPVVTSSPPVTVSDSPVTTTLSASLLHVANNDTKPKTAKEIRREKQRQLREEKRHQKLRERNLKRLARLETKAKKREQVSLRHALPIQ